LKDHDYSDIVKVGNFIENISYYIAGFVTQSIAKKRSTNYLSMLIADKRSKSHYTRSQDYLIKRIELCWQMQVKPNEKYV